MALEHLLAPPTTTLGIGERESGTIVGFIRFLLLVGLILNAFCLIRVFGFESELQAWQGSEYFLQWRHLCGAGACHFSKVFSLLLKIVFFRR